LLIIALVQHQYLVTKIDSGKRVFQVKGQEICLEMQEQVKMARHKGRR
jgi:hypothetical protein